MLFYYTLCVQLKPCGLNSARKHRYTNCIIIIIRCLLQLTYLNIVKQICRINDEKRSVIVPSESTILNQIYNNTYRIYIGIYVKSCLLKKNNSDDSFYIFQFGK